MFDYSVRVSKKAKRVLLKVGPRGLEVVVPPGFDPARAPEIIERRRDWIERAFRRLRVERGPRPDPAEPPNRLALRALGRMVLVERADRPGRPCRLGQLGPDRLLLGGDIASGDWRGLLREWLRGLARLELIPRLRGAGEELGLGFRAGRIGCQRTRWGSCSSTGTISLNLRLLFLPPDLVRYVMIHELCHLERLDHSPEYWRIVRRYEPDVDELEARLKRGTAFVPAWLES